MKKFLLDCFVLIINMFLLIFLIYCLSVSAKILYYVARAGWRLF